MASAPRPRCKVPRPRCRRPDVAAKLEEEDAALNDAGPDECHFFRTAGFSYAFFFFLFLFLFLFSVVIVVAVVLLFSATDPSATSPSPGRRWRVLANGIFSTAQRLSSSYPVQ